MNQITQPDVAEKETVDFLTIIIVNYHLMILYVSIIYLPRVQYSKSEFTWICHLQGMTLQSPRY